MDEQKAKNKEYELKIGYLTDAVNKLEKTFSKAFANLDKKLDQLVDQKDTIKNDVSAMRSQYALVVVNQSNLLGRVEKTEEKVDANEQAINHVELELDRVYTYARAYRIFIPVITGIVTSVLTAVILTVIGLK